MEELIKKAHDTALEKLASVSTLGQLKRQPKKRKSPTGQATALIMPEEHSPDLWESPGGSYLRGATLGAGTATGLGWAGGGVHWSGRTPLGITKKTRKKALETAKKIKADKMLEASERAKWSRKARWLALGGAAAGTGATAYYRHKAKKRKEDLAKMPKQIVVKIPSNQVVKARVKKAADKMKIKAPKIQKPGAVKTEAPGPPKAPGKDQTQQSVKITTAPISKAAAERAQAVLESLRS